MSLKEELVATLEELWQTEILVLSCQYLALRKHQRLDHLIGARELDDFVPFNTTYLNLLSCRRHIFQDLWACTQ